MDGISRSRGWDKDIPHGVLPMEKLVLSDKWARKYGNWHNVGYAVFLPTLSKSASGNLTL